MQRFMGSLGRQATGQARARWADAATRARGTCLSGAGPLREQRWKTSPTDCPALSPASLQACDRLLCSTLREVHGNTASVNAAERSVEHPPSVRPGASSSKLWRLPSWSSRRQHADSPIPGDGRPSRHRHRLSRRQLPTGRWRRRSGRHSKPQWHSQPPWHSRQLLPALALGEPPSQGCSASLPQPLEFLTCQPR